MKLSSVEMMLVESEALIRTSKYFEKDIEEGKATLESVRLLDEEQYKTQKEWVNYLEDVLVALKAMPEQTERLQKNIETTESGIQANKISVVATEIFAKFKKEIEEGILKNKGA